MKYDKERIKKILAILGKEVEKNEENISRIIIEQIKGLWNKGLSKLRFSLVLRLNAAYVLKLIGILFWLNIAGIAISTYYIGSTIKENTNNVSEVVIDELNDSKSIDEERMDIISKSSGLYLMIYNEDKEILYSSSEDAKSEFIFQVSEDSTLQKDSNNAEENVIKGDVLGYNYGVTKEIDSKAGKLIVNLYDKPYSRYQKLLIPFLMLLAFEGIIIIITINKGAKKTRKILMPIDVMTNTVKQITVDELNTRLDISGSQNELKDLALTFNEMLDRLQHSYEIQNQFVSDASHELRTPIAVIQGYAKLLDRWGKEDEKILLESIEAIKTEAQDMKDLVEKLLFLARGDKNTQEVKRDNFNLSDLMEEVYKETKLIDKDHIINLENSDSVIINGDRKLLKEMLRIFVDNAVKYTKSGGTVTLGLNKSLDKVQIFIKDTGIGISKDDLPNIFNRFYRADKSRTKDTGGTGLGLAIAKWIVMKHKGSIVVESKVNEGTKFIIKLPND